MSGCDNQGLAPVLHSRSLQKLVVGSDFEMQIRLAEMPSRGNHAITSFVGASALFPNADGDTDTCVTGTVLSADRGIITFPMTGAQTENFLQGQEPAIELYVQEGGKSYFMDMYPAFEISGRIVT